MKPTIANKVTAAAETLRAMTETKQLREWAIANNMDNRSAFASFKRALLTIGIDYDALRSDSQAQQAEALEASATHEITLYSDAKASHERFAICDREGEPVWYGRFFDGEGSEQSAAELEAAKKAVWLASRIRSELKAPAIKLTLIVDANWLCTLSGKAAALATIARKGNVVLSMEWIRGTENPADKWTTEKGYEKPDIAALAAITASQSKAPAPPSPTALALAALAFTLLTQATFCF